MFRARRCVGTVALVFGLVFVTTSVIRFTRPNLDVVLAVLNAALGASWLGAGIWLWRLALRKTTCGR